MKKVLLVILIALTGVAFALPLSVEARAGFIYVDKETQLFDQRTTLNIEVYKGLELGLSVGFVEGEVATGMGVRYAYPTKSPRIVARAGVWQFDECMGYIGIGGEIPLKHITFGIGADMGWTKTRSFVAPSVWIILH